MSLHFQIHSETQSQNTQRGLGEEDPTDSQSAHRELAPTYPNQVYRLVCFHLKNLASSRAPVAFAREKEHSGRHTQEGRQGMCSDTLNPGGEVRGCCVGCILGMSEIPPYVFIAASYQLHEISRTKETVFQAGMFPVRGIFVVF